MCHLMYCVFSFSFYFQSKRGREEKDNYITVEKFFFCPPSNQGKIKRAVKMVVDFNSLEICLNRTYNSNSQIYSE